MKLRKQSIIKIDGLKEKKFASVPDFVKWALQVYGSNYETIQQQMKAVNKFAFKSDLSEPKKAYQTLFNGDAVDDLQFLPGELAVKHETKLFNEESASYKIAVQKNADKPGVMLKLTEKITDLLGREKEDLTTLHFSDNHLTLESKYNADWGKNFNKKDFSYNNYARDQVNYEFGFDKTNQLTQYSYYRCTSESVNWNRSQIMDLLNTQNETDLTK